MATDGENLPDARTSLVQVRIGNRTYEATYSPRCHTCCHPARMQIEEMILQNHSYRSIAGQFSGQRLPSPDGSTAELPPITWNSIYHHFKAGHTPLGPATLRALSERRAARVGSSYEEATERFVDHVVLAEAVVGRTHERLVSGEIEPDVRDGLAAAKLLKDVEDGAHRNTDVEAWGQAMTVYFEAAQRIMPPQMWAQFTAALAVDPILRAIGSRGAESVVDAEIVHEEAG